MTKWFDTNYHYIVPELDPRQKFRLSAAQIFDQFAEAKSLGIQTRPVLLGPVSFLALAKSVDAKTSSFSLLDALLPVYQEALDRLRRDGRRMGAGGRTHPRYGHEREGAQRA